MFGYVLYSLKSFQRQTVSGKLTLHLDSLCLYSAFKVTVSSRTQRQLLSTKKLKHPYFSHLKPKNDFPTMVVVFTHFCTQKNG